MKKIHVREQEDKMEGGYYTKIYLEGNKKWTKPSPQLSCCAATRIPRKMIERAWDWARQTGNLRVNEVHGEEEIRCVLNETFFARNIHKEESERRGTMEVQDI